MSQKGRPPLIYDASRSEAIAEKPERSPLRKGLLRIMRENSWEKYEYIAALTGIDRSTLSKVISPNPDDSDRVGIRTLARLYAGLGPDIEPYIREYLRLLGERLRDGGTT